MTRETRWDYDGYRLRRLTDVDQTALLRWRNRPEVRKAMLTSHEISPTEHAAWWARTQNDPARVWCLLERGQAPVAVVNFFDVGEDEAWWGFYLVEESIHSAAERLAVWTAAERIAAEHAFNVLGVTRLLCETLASNAPVLALHRRFGFTERVRRIVARDGRSEELVEMVLEKAGSESLAGTVARRRVALLGSANWGIAGGSLRELAAARGIEVSLTDVPFGQYRLWLCDAESPLRTTLHDYVIFCERIEDLMPVPFAALDGAQAAAIEARFAEYLTAIEQARAVMQGRFIVTDLAPVRPAPSSLGDAAYEPGAVQALVHRLNQRLADMASRLPDTQLFALSSLIGDFGARHADPGKYWALGRFPFSGTFLRHFMQRIVGGILAWEGRTVRALVLDLDNTLWGGVIGDDGLAGIQLGGDHPGNLFSQFQSLLKSLRGRGIALAVCSKNTDAIAWGAVANHAGMVLGPADFACRRINWQPKPANIREIARELGLGVGSLMLIDDNPHERMEARRAIPELVVPEMPGDIGEWPRFLGDLPELAAWRLTDEDRLRAERYAARAQLAVEADRFEDREAFLASLGMRVAFDGLTAGNRQRVLQLLAKTNQFNTTTRRYGDADLQRILAAGGEVIAVSLADRLTTEETIGVVIVLYPSHRSEPVAIDDLLLSCRVLGRGVERAVLAWVTERARRAGFRTVSGRVLPTARNQPVSGVFGDAGFEVVGDGHYALDLAQTAIEAPYWIAVEDRMARRPGIGDEGSAPELVCRSLSARGLEGETA